MKAAKICLLSTVVFFCCCVSKHPKSINYAELSKQRWALSDSLMQTDAGRHAMWDTIYDKSTISQACTEVRNQSGRFGFFYYKGAPNLVFSKEEWDALSSHQQTIATKVAKQLYNARCLVKTFFMRHGEISKFNEHFYIHQDGGWCISYRIEAEPNDAVQSLFTLETFIINLQTSKFKYYSTIIERKPIPGYHRGLMERDIRSSYHNKWIDIDDPSYSDIAPLVKALQKAIDCSLLGEAKSIENKLTTEAVRPEENQQLQPEETRIWREMNAALEGNLTDIQEPAEGKSLNEIRFEGWTDQDWLDNEYIRTLRTHLDAYVQGNIADPTLDPYKEVLRGKFGVWVIEPFILGGVLITILPIDDPQNLLEAWVYSEVQDGKVIGYSVMTIKPSDTPSGVSKEEMAEIIEKNPEIILW